MFEIQSGKLGGIGVVLPAHQPLLLGGSGTVLKRSTYTFQSGDT